MTIARRMQIAAVVILLSAVGGILLLFWNSRQVGYGIKEIDTTAQITNSAFMLRILMVEFLNEGNEKSLEQWAKQNQRLGQLLNDGTLAESTDPDLLRQIRKSYDAMKNLYPHVIEMRTSRENESGDLPAGELLNSLILLQLEQLVNQANDLSKATQSLTLERRNFVQQLILSLGMLAVVIILIYIYQIRRSVVNPLTALSTTAERIGEGNYDFIPDTKSDDEVGKLAQSFNTMVLRLRERSAALKKAYNELELRVQERTAELEKAKESITEERQRLHDILETLPSVISLLTPDYRIAFANRAFRERFGEIVGRHCFESCFGLRAPCGFCETYSVLETGRPHRWEHKSLDGASIYDVNAFPFTDLDGSPLILEVSIDITEQRKAQEAVAIERRRLYDILETMPIIVCLLTPDHRVAYANSAFREKFGEDTDRHCFDLIFGSKEPCEFCEAYNVLETGKPHHWEVTGPDGSIFDVYNSPFADTDGSPLILEIDIDITEQKRAREALRMERQRLYDVLETLPVYVCLLDSDYRMPFANLYFRETFGESHGRSCHDFLFNRTEPCEICESYTAMKTGAPHHWYWTGPNGKDYDIYDFPFTDNDGSRLVLEMGIDITDRKRAEAELIRANESLSEEISERIRAEKDRDRFFKLSSDMLCFAGFDGYFSVCRQTKWEF